MEVSILDPKMEGLAAIRMACELGVIPCDVIMEVAGDVSLCD